MAGGACETLSKVLNDTQGRTLWNTKQRDEFYLAAYAVVANEITHYRTRGCFCNKYPAVLPDAKWLAKVAHQKIQDELFEVHFRSHRKLLEALQIDYDQVLAKKGPSRDESGSAKKAMKGSAPAAGDGDVEAPAE